MLRTISTLIAVAVLGVLNPALALTIGALLFLVLIHELGHLLVARRLGIKATEFSVGFGPELLSRQTNRTKWVWRAFPLGGYVRLSGQGGDGDDWQVASPTKRIAVAFAGPATNIIFAIVLLAGAFAAVGTDVETGRVGSVGATSAAAAAGITAGDRITSVDGVATPTFAALADRLSTDVDGRVRLDVERSDGTRVIRNAELRNGVLGVSAETRVARLTPSETLEATWRGTGALLKGNVNGMGNVAVSLVSAPLRLVGLVGPAPVEKRALSPVGMSRVVAQTEREVGFAGVLWILAAISMFLGVFNLVPFGPLDGGRIVAEPIAWAARRLGLSGRGARARQALSTAFILVIVVGGISTLLLDLLNPLNL